MSYDLENAEVGPAHSPFVPVLQIAIDVLELLVRRWWMVLTGMAVGVGIATHINSSVPDYYSAAAKFIVDDSTVQSPSNPDQSDIQADRRMSLQRRIEVIRSIPIADAVYRILNGQGEAPSGEWAPGDGAAPAPARGQDMAEIRLEERLKDPSYLSGLLSLRSEISVSADADSSMLIISTTGSDPKALVRTPNAYVQAYRAHCLAQKTAADRRMLRSSETSLEFASQYLSRAAGIESNFRQKNHLPPRAKKSAMPAPILSGASPAALPRPGAGLPPRENASSTRGESGLQLRQNILLECMRALDQLLDLQEEFAPENTAVTSKQLEILGLQDSLAEQDGTFGSTQLRRQTYEQELAAEFTRTSPNGPVEHAAFVLEHTVALADALYAVALSQQRDIKVRLSLAADDVHLVEPATIPTSPAGPDRSKNTRNGASAGFLVVLMILLVREYGDARVRGVNSVLKVTGSTVLATFPYDEHLSSRPVEETLVIQDEGFSPMAEAVRELRTRLMVKPGAPPTKGILITSAFSGDGKTFVAANLAVSLAQVGQRILVVDGDLRKPQLHRVFGMSNTVGVSELTTLDSVYQLIRPCILPNLHVLTSGPAIASPAELLSQAGTQEILRALLSRYDQVIFDSPPINLVADASILAGLSQVAVLVVRDGGCTESELAGAVERVNKSNVRLAGVVLNRIRRSVLSYGYGYGYGYGGRYYYSSSRQESVSKRNRPLP
jgi:capsular exopolysaccharide synthesis family protein